MPSKNYDEKGHFIPDDSPVEVPLRFKTQETEAERIARAVSLEFSQQADDKGFETFEDAQDFDVDDEFDIFPQSSFEIQEMEEEYLPDTPSDKEKTLEEKLIEEADGEKNQEAEQNERVTPPEDAKSETAS